MSTWAIIISSMISVFLPSSLSGVISPGLAIIQSFICVLLLTILINLKSWQFINLLAIFAILALFFVFTLASPFSYVAWGALAPYLLLFALLLTDININNNNKIIKKEIYITLIIVNIAIITFGFATILRNDFAEQLSENYYQAFSEGLFQSMIIWYAKPVTFFATHSISAFVYFSLFFLNRRLSHSKELNKIFRIIFSISSIGYLILLPFLSSTTAIVLFGLAVLYVFGKTIQGRNSSLKIAVTVAIILSIAAVYVLDIIEIANDVAAILSMEDGGFLSRYASGGRLQGTYEYLIENYFQPIGITYSTQIAFGDNFIAEYILRISFLGYLLIIIMFVIWLKFNIIDKQTRIWVLFIVLLADLGYPLLTYPRVTGFMPLFFLLWNSAPTDRRNIS
jgi:hypothetical protein